MLILQDLFRKWIAKIALQSVRVCVQGVHPYVRMHVDRRGDGEGPRVGLSGRRSMKGEEGGGGWEGEIRVDSGRQREKVQLLLNMILVSGKNFTY